jgi:hypothetical protein
VFFRSSAIGTDPTALERTSSPALERRYISKAAAAFGSLVCDVAANPTMPAPTLGVGDSSGKLTILTGNLTPLQALLLLFSQPATCGRTTTSNAALPTVNGSVPLGRLSIHEVQLRANVDRVVRPLSDAAESNVALVSEAFIGPPPVDSMNGSYMM